jgi:hypothetical protein
MSTDEGDEAATAPAGPRVIVPFAAKLSLALAFVFTLAVGFLPSPLADTSTDATATVNAQPK